MQPPIAQPPPIRPANTAKTVGIAIIVVLFMSVGGCFVCVGIGAKAVSKKETATTSPSTPKKADPVKLATLLADYKSNEVRADGLYKGKYIAIDGVAGDIKKDVFGSVFVTVGNGRSFEDVQCYLASDQVGRASALSKGQPVHLVGQVDGLVLLSVMMKECEIR